MYFDNVITKFIKNNINKILVLFVPIIFFLIIITLTNDTKTKTSKINNVKEINSGWIISSNGNEKKIKNLPIKESIESGKKYSIKNTLPSDIVNETYLLIRDSKQKITVYIDGNKVYQNNNKYSENKTLFVPLKKAYANKEIKIVFSSEVGIFSGRIDRIFYGNHLDGLLLQLKFTGRLLLFYTFVSICGIMQIIIYLVIMSKKKRYNEFLYLGLFTTSLAIIMIADNNLLQFYSVSPITNIVVSIVLKLFLPFSLIGFIYSESISIRTKNILKILLFLFVVADVIIFITSLYSVNHIIQAMQIYQLITIVLFFILMIIVIMEIVIDNNLNIIDTYLAMSCLGFTIVVEIISYFQYIVDFYNMGIFLGAGLLSYLIIKGSVLIYKMISKIEEAEKVKQQLFDTRIRVMFSQIKPHFIYNTLNTIEALIDIDTQKASEMIISFSKYLRSHIDTIGQENLITFGEEINNIKAYTDIEVVRFPKIKVVYNTSSTDFLVPVLSIQPLVENAIKHGISKRIKGGTVYINSYEEKENNIVEIIDDGVGFNVSATVKDGHVGMKNITFRLNNLVNAVVKCDSKPNEGTKVTVLVPKK